MTQYFDPEAFRAATKADLFRLAKARTVEIGGDDVIGPDDIREDDGDD